MTMNIYIDIDGVLLTKRQEIPKDGKEFIDFLIENYNCFWLTTHCRTGENKALNYLSKFYDEDTIRKLRKVEPTNWMDLKTEAINLNSNFIWLDDQPFEAEKIVLKRYNKLNSLIIVDLDRENELLNIKNMIKLKVI